MKHAPAPHPITNPVMGIPDWQLIALSGFSALLLAPGGGLFYIIQAKSICATQYESLKSNIELKVNQLVQWRNERINHASLYASNHLIFALGSN